MWHALPRSPIPGRSIGHGPKRMTVTEARPEADAPVDRQSASDPFAGTGLAGAFGTGDHKTLGRLYLYFGLLGGLLSVVMAAFVRLERADISGVDVLTFGSSNQYFQVWSLSRTALLFFCVVPLLLGLATYLVPLQVGAPSIAFPRAAAAAFWTWLVAISIHVVTVFVDGGLGYPDLDPSLGTGALGPDPQTTELSLLSIGLVVVAILLATVCILTTVICQRTQGMTLFDTPLFSWSMLVAGGIWLLSLPIWLANLAIAWVDFRGEDAVRYGNVNDMWDYLDWLWSPPMVFAFAIPVLGIVGDIIPVSAGVRQTRYGAQQAAIAVFGVLTFGAYAQPAFSIDVKEQAVYVVMGLLLAVAALAFLGGIGASLSGGRIRPSAHLLIALAAFVVLLLGTLAGVVAVAGPAIGVIHEFDSTWLVDVTDWFDDLQGTTLASGVVDLALTAGLIGAVAGIYFWGAKLFGRRMNGSIGALAGLALLGGAVLSGGTNVVSGMLHEGDRVYSAGAYSSVSESGAVETLNVLGFVGVALVGLGIILVLGDLVLAIGMGTGQADNADDPWDGHTLEWATDSPPPPGNFPTAPVVTSERPLLDAKEGDQ
jgi:cytochrome c oxidase subunit I